MIVRSSVKFSGIQHLLDTLRMGTLDSLDLACGDWSVWKQFAAFGAHGRHIVGTWWSIRKCWGSGRRSTMGALGASGLEHRIALRIWHAQTTYID